jgi:hypothetical protein
MWSNPHAHILLKIYNSTSNENLNSAKYTDTLQCAIKDISSHQHGLHTCMIHLKQCQKMTKLYHAYLHYISW